MVVFPNTSGSNEALSSGCTIAAPPHYNKSAVPRCRSLQAMAGPWPLYSGPGRLEAGKPPTIVANCAQPAYRRSLTRYLPTHLSAQRESVSTVPIGLMAPIGELAQETQIFLIVASLSDWFAYGA